MFLDGERTGVKVKPTDADKALRRVLPVEEFLRSATIRSYFARLTRDIKAGKQIEVDTAEDVVEDNEEDDNDEYQVSVEGLLSVSF